MLRKDFRMLNNWTMFDNSSITFKPDVVINAINEFYSSLVTNPHSKESSLSSIVLEKIDKTRCYIAELVNCKREEVIFTSGTTHSINLLVGSLKPNIKPDDEIILFNDSHASGVIPLLNLRKITKCKLNFVTTVDELEEKLNKNTKIIFYPQCNNSTGGTHDYKKIYSMCKLKSPDSLVINDIAQAISHSKVDFKYADAFTFSGGKIYGPTGTGGLILNEDLINSLTPDQYGGGMSINFDQNGWIPKVGFEKWESGTANVAGIVGLGAAIKYFLDINIKNIEEHERNISIYLRKKLLEIKNIHIFSKIGSHIILFAIDGVNSQDLCSALGNHNILSRSGKHCANLMNKVLKYNLPTLRLSIALYNDKSDVDKIVDFIKNEHILAGLV